MHQASWSTPQPLGLGDAMSPQQAAAITNNEKVFPVFAKKLASDDEDMFCNTASKLSTWLNSEKAYYAAARPKIVDLLEIAQATLRRQKGGDQNEPIHIATYPSHLTPWVTAYAGLVRTVVRFSGMFSEPDLTNRLRILFQTGKLSLPTTNFSPVPPTQHVLPTQQSPGPSTFQWAPQQNENKAAANPNAGLSTPLQWMPAQFPSRPSSRPASAATMRPSSSSLASALNGQDSPLTQNSPPYPSRSPMDTMPVIATRTPISTPVNPSSTAQMQKEKEMVVETKYGASITQGSAFAFVPSQAPAGPSNVVSAGALSTTNTSLITSNHPTVPTPAQVLSMSTRPQLPPIRIPARPVPEKVITVQSPPPTIPPQTQVASTSTQPPQRIPSSSFSPTPIHTPSSASASTSVPPTAKETKKKKITISEDLALSDLEWLKMKRKKDAEAPRKSAPASAVGTPTSSVTGETKKGIPGSEDLALSDAVWLQTKRKKDLGDADKPAAGGEGGENIVTPATVGPVQLAHQPGGAGSGTTSELAFKSIVTDPEPDAERPIEGTVHTASSAVADQPPANIPGVHPEPVARDQAPQPHPVYSVAPMDVDLPPSETGAGVDVSSQRVEQHVADVVGDAEMASESIISETPPANVHGVQPEAVYRDQAQPQSVRASGPMDIDLPPSEISAEVAVDEHVAEVMGASGHPPPAESDTFGDVDMVAGDTVIASGDHAAIDDDAAIESARAASTVIDSAQPNLQTNDSVPAMDNLLEDGESSPTPGAAGEHPVDDEMNKETRGGRPRSKKQKHPDFEAVTIRGTETSDIPVVDRTDGQGSTLKEPSAIRETSPTTEVISGNATKGSRTSNGMSMPPESMSTSEVALITVSAGLENEMNTMPPPSVLAVPESRPRSPNVDNSTSIRARTSSPMEISLSPDLRLNGHPPISRKSHRSSSPHTGSDYARRRLGSSRGPLDTVTNKTASHSVKQENASEMEVLQFLNAIPLCSQDVVNGFPRMIAAPAREPRKIEFGSEMVVIAARRGSSSIASLTINFNVDDNQMSLISHWVNQNSANDVSHSMCLSLACYHWADLIPMMQSPDGSQSMEDVLVAARCSWPIKGGLSMVVQRGEDEWHLPLAPPLAESSENLVDVSTFVRPKTNTFRILQHSDMSAFVFALHAHLPTRQQLQAVTRQRKKAQQFRDDLKNWSRPVDVPLPPVWSSACTPSN